MFLSHASKKNINAKVYAVSSLEHLFYNDYYQHILISFLLGPLMHDTQYSDNEYVPIVCKSFSKEKKKLIKLCNTNSLILKNFKIQRIRKHKHN